MSSGVDILTCQFLEKMKGNDPLEARLSVAKQVFVSYSIPISNKEEIVLVQLCKLASASRGQDRTQVIKCIDGCLKSKRMVNFSGDFSPEVVDTLCDVLALHSLTPTEYGKETPSALVECAVSVLSTPYFQRWFTCDVKNLCQLLGNVLTACTPHSFNEVIKLMSLLSLINQHTLFKDETREAFLTSTLIPLCDALTMIPDDEYCSLHSRVTDTFVRVVMYNPTFLDDFTSKKKSGGGDDELTPSHRFISSIKTAVKAGKISSSSLKTCFKIILLSSIKTLSKAQNYESMFDVFRTLCSMLGCRVDKTISITWKPVKNWDHNHSYDIIADLIDVLNQAEVPLSIDYGTFTLGTWFMSLVIGTLNINLNNLSPELIKMIERVFNYNPLIIENCSKCLSDVMVRRKSPDALKPYTSLMKVVLDGAAQIQRLQKLITTLLCHLKISIDSQSSKACDLMLIDILPEELTGYFSEIIVVVPNSQILALFKDILDHLQRNSLEMLEASCTDISVVLMTEIASELLRQLLFSVKIADHSVPDNIKLKFNVLLEDLKVILEKIGNILVEDHHDRLLKSFLDMSHAFGAVQRMIEDYEGSPMKPVNKLDLIPFNFSYVHPYLPPQVWKRIGESIADHSNCIAHRSLCNLMVQKVEAVAQVEEGSEGPGTQTARRLLTISDPQWLWKEITNLAPLFQAGEVVQLIGTLVDSLGSDQERWFELIKLDEFIENRRLVLALSLQLLTKLSSFLSNEGDKLGNDMIAHLRIGSLLEYELSLLLTEDDGLALEIKESIELMKKTLNNHMNVQPFDEKKNFGDISFIRVLHALPTHHFSVLSQSCISLMALVILVQMPPFPDADHLLMDVLLRTLFNPLKPTGKILVSGLNSGILLKFLSNKGVHYPSLKILVGAICKESFHERKTAKKLIKAVSNPTVEDVWQTTAVLEAVSQLKKKRVKSEKYELEETSVATETPVVNKDECLDSLMRLLMPILQKEPPSLDLLPTYSLILSVHFKTKKVDGIDSILTKSEDYLRLCSLDPEVGISLVETLLLFRSQLNDEKLKKAVAMDGWKLLVKNKKQPKFLARINEIFTSSTDEEFRSISVGLLSETSAAISERDNEQLGALLDLWSPLLSAQISFAKSKIRQEALVSLCKVIPTTIDHWESTPEDKSIACIMDFFSNLAAATAVEIKPAVLDTFLVCLQRVPLPQEKPSILLDNLSSAIEAHFALYLFRNVLILDRLHVYLPIYRSYMTSLAKISHPEFEIIERAIPCADKLERVAKTMVKRHKDFARLAQYIVADVIGIFEHNVIHSEVKMKFTNVINSFLSLCDEHATSYLAFSLPPASQELFKSLLHNYEKYHKFVGKI